MNSKYEFHFDFVNILFESVPVPANKLLFLYFDAIFDCMGRAIPDSQRTSTFFHYTQFFSKLQTMSFCFFSKALSNFLCIKFIHSFESVSNTPPPQKKKSPY